MKGAERGGRKEGKWKRQKQRETPGGSVEKGARLRRTALSVQFKNRQKKKTTNKLQFNV